MVNGGTATSYRLLGQGRSRVVLIHGLGGDGSDWITQPMTDQIASADASFLAVDLPGHGHDTTATDPRAAALSHVTDEISRTAGSLGWESYGVIGYSFGGVIALLIAQRDSHVRWSIAGGVTTTTVETGHATTLAGALLAHEISDDPGYRGHCRVHA